MSEHRLSPRRALVGWGCTCLAALVCVAHPGWSLAAPAGEPQGFRFEAEENAGSDSKVIDDAGASGGKAVENARAWQPLISLDVPAEGGERLTVSVRRKGGPIQLKTVVDGKQVERKSDWKKPTEWTWTDLGTYTRAELGTRVLVIRGQGDQVVQLDALVFASAQAANQGGGGAASVPATGGNVLSLPSEATEQATSKVMPAAEPDASLPPVTVDAIVNWSQVVAPVRPGAWGIADYEIKDPKSASEPGYLAFLKKLSPPLVRIHHASFPSAWLTADERAWDVEKIKACWAAAGPAYGDAKVMMNLAYWPKWMAREDGTLDPAHYDAYAQLYVDLMRIMRDEVKHPIAYWEITNERDGLYEKRERLDELWQVYNTVALAMRKADPTAKLGGPAFTWAKPLWVNGFVQNCIANADFVTYHNYGIGDVYDPNEKLYGTLNTIERHARFIRQAVDAAAPDRHVEIFLDEYNVKWVWNPIEPRHANSVGAAFQAAVVRRATLAGIDGATVWHLKGNAYGLIDSKNVERPTSALFRWGPKHLVGDMVAANLTLAAGAEGSATSAGAVDDLVELFPVAGPNGERSLLVICKAPRSVVLPSATSLLGGAPTKVARVDATGIHETVELNANGPMTVPGYSLTLLTMKE